MDAFDYFLLVFVISDVAKDFDTTKTKVAIATTLTLAARPVGAALFGYWADKVGRRTPLLVVRALLLDRRRSAPASRRR